MKDGDEMSFDIELKVDRKLVQVGQNTRVDQTYFVVCKMPDGKEARKQIGTGTFIVAGFVEDAAELEGCRIIKQPTGIGYKEAVLQAQLEMEKSHGRRIAQSRKGWEFVDPKAPLLPKNVGDN